MSNYQNDTQFYEQTVRGTSDEPDEKGFTLQISDGGFIFVHNENNHPLPKPGTVLRFYGKGFGFPVRGIVDANNDVVYFYNTQEEDEERHRQWVPLLFVFIELFLLGFILALGVIHMAATQLGKKIEEINAGRKW